MNQNYEVRDYNGESQGFFHTLGECHQYCQETASFGGQGQQYCYTVHYATGRVRYYVATARTSREVECF